METTSQPACGTVEYYSAILSRFTGPGEEKHFHEMTVMLIANTLDESSRYTDEARLAHARNVIIAAGLVRAELAAE